ncbi:TPA: hypothetical protein ACOECQ_001414 [Stenotrophomonas maltophilia]|uniref:hypothetical protein n=2 Tax=Stenotrophomonas maltophilia TaxID=40324 RepID=UPI001E40A55F|nr:hypothetical protein [Stenotrophomonas maltophilia]
MSRGRFDGGAAQTTGRSVETHPLKRIPADYVQQNLAVRLVSLPWMTMGVVMFGSSATIPLELGVVLTIANCAVALYLADYLLRLRAAGGGLYWLIIFFSTSVLALVCAVVL